MRKLSIGVLACTAAAALALAGCGSSGGASNATPGGSSPAAAGKVGVILPDTKSSARWENNDRPSLKKAFDAAGVASDIQSSADFDLDLRLSSNSLKELWPLPFADAIQQLRPVVAEAHVNKTGSKWAVSQLRARVGHTDLAGDLTFNDEHSAGRRSNYRATLRSTALDISDISPLTGMVSSPIAKTVSTDHALQFA